MKKIAKTIMVQGTGSHVGKSGLTEHFRQNMDMEKFYDILNEGLN